VVNRVQAGQQLGNYRLLQQLGTGGFAEVYLGEHRYLKRQVAIKVLQVSLAGDDKESERFRQEAQTMAALKHPHIIGCLDFGIEHNIPYIVMDYAPGGTLRDLHPEGDQVPLDTVVAYIEQVADALQYAHDQGVIHLDVKPENMLLGSNGEILLSDFGLARFTRSVSTRVTSLIGTISYMAPEYIQRRPQAASDQYSLAMVAYEWLTGVRPFDGDDERIVVGQQLQTLPPSLRDFVPTLPAAVDEVIRASLAKKPEERYPRIGEFAKALSMAADSEVDEEFDLVPIKPEVLYSQGLQAKGQGKLEQAKEFLEELQFRVPDFRADVVQEQLQQIDEALHPQLLARYRDEAEAANREGQWDQEIEAWKNFLQADPSPLDAREARTRLRLAGEHQRNAHLYQDAAHMVADKNTHGARELLQQLYAKDHYYGDPLGLGKKLKVKVPPTYQQEQAERRKEEARQDRREEAEAREAERRDFAQEAYGKQLGKLWLVWLAWFLFLCGVGATVGALTQSWIIALVALAAASAASWGLGYRKALSTVPLAIIVVGSLALTLLLTLSLAHVDYVHALASPYTETISTGFFTSKDLTVYHHLYLGRQLIFGLIWGTVTALVGVVVAFFFRPPYGKQKKEERPTFVTRGIYRAYPSRPTTEPEKSLYLSIANLAWIVLCTGTIGFTFWAGTALIAPMNDWGFGFDLGVNLAWLGLLLGSVLLSGVGASLPIWWTAIRQWVQERR
jgi:FtsH-binding integral membrane protein